MKSSFYDYCECGGTIHLINSGSNRYPVLQIKCDTCSNGTSEVSVLTKREHNNSKENYNIAFNKVRQEWISIGKSKNGLKYEFFCDVSYFDTYLVRDKRDRNFGCGWSVNTKKEALDLCNILNDPSGILIIEKEVSREDKKYILNINEHKIQLHIHKVLINRQER
jgi:hypothetical protein